MERIIDALVITPGDKNGKLAELIQSVYGEHCNFNNVEFTTSLRKGIKTLEEENFQLCFIAGSVPMEDLEVFMNDFKAMNKDMVCGFVLVHKELKTIGPDEEGESTDLETPIKLGVHAIVTEKGTHADKDALTEAMRDFAHEEEVVKRKIDVDSALNVMLRKIDNAARNIKRGMDPKIDAVPSEFIELQTAYDEEVLNSYFDKLEDKTEECEPENSEEISVPDKVLARDLPKLEKNKYVGVSDRVWKKLLRKHGVDGAGVEEAAAQPESPAPESVSGEEIAEEILEGAQAGETTITEVDEDLAGEVPVSDSEPSEISSAEEGVEKPAS